MAVSTQIIKRTYSANGTNRSWDVDFPLADRADLRVWIISPQGVQQEVENFTFNAAGTAVEYPTQSSEQDPLAAGWKISLVRQTPLTQEIDLIRHGALDAEVLESGYDKLTLISQELHAQATQNATDILANATALAAETAARETAVSSEATARQAADASLQSALESGLVSKLDSTTAASTYLAKTDAANTYLTQANAASTYLSQSDASSTYLTQANAASTYLSQTSAASTYATQSALSSALATKQDTLTTAQTAAANSGVTSDTVAQVAANAATITALVPFIQSAGVHNMNEQEIVDAADLLAATASFRALDLDLSKNTQLKKLTAKGTSESLANLSRAVVSPLATLDSSTSPQVDVSYSALNRTALVGLFDSLPFNVGYDMVGSPTVCDGVASNFTSSDYLKTSLYPNYPITSFEFGITFTVPSSDLTSSGAITFHYSKPPSGTNLNGVLRFGSGGDLVLFLFKKSDDTYRAYSATGYDFRNHLGETYSAVFSTDMSTVILKSYDKAGALITSNHFADQDLVATITAPIYFGGSPQASTSYTGSINMNKTYININGKPWFRGKATSTKTCNVAGATGTADLTSDDKAVATNKGWSLTLA